MATTATTTTRNGAHKTTEQSERPGIAMKYDDDGTRMRGDVQDHRWAARVVGRCGVVDLKHFLISNNLH